MTAIPSPVPYFIDLDGDPLDGGYIYVGTAGMDARTNPIQIYWDNALTIPAPQPIRTVNGYPLYQGRPAAFFIAAGGASVTVLQSNGVAVITNAPFVDVVTSFIADLAAPDGSNLVGFSFDETYSDGTVGKALWGGVRMVTAAPYNAAADNVANDSAAIQAAIADGVAVTPDHLIKMDTAITGEFRAISLGTQFTGAHPLDEQYPTFGPGALKVMYRGSFANSIIGIAHGTAPASTLTFPTGVTGYARMDNGGNCCFGIYAEARTYATTGIPTNEIDTFNHGGPPTGILPPDRSIGTAQQVPVGITVGADGDYNSDIGIHISIGGQQPRKWLTGIYIGQNSCVNYGLFIDAIAGSTYTSMFVRHSTARTGFILSGVGAVVPASAAFQIFDGTAVDAFAIKQNGDLFIKSLQILTTRRTGWTAATGTATRTTFATGAVTLPVLAEHVKALIDDLMTHGVIGT